MAARAAGVAYVPPDRKVSGAFMHLTAAENMSVAHMGDVWRGGFLRLKREAAEARRWFESLQVRPIDGVKAEFATFSGGNQQKIVFGKWLRTTPSVLLLDEPTQGVDVGAKAELPSDHQTCADGLAVLVSSTDVKELATLCDRVLFIVSGRMVGEMRGGGFTDISINRTFHEVQSEHGVNS
jgi:ribose transport system ATP-binding protein